jgi:hypothetical protein
MLTSMLCPLLGHRVNRSRVWHDGIDYRTSCERCDAPLLRAEEGWRPFRSDTDLVVGGLPRKPHPHHRNGDTR